MIETEPIRDRRKIERIKSVLRDTSARDYLLFTLGINLAVRIGDLLSLKIKDVLTKEGSIKKAIHFKEQKTNRDIYPAVNAASLEALEFYFEKVKARNSDTYLFRKDKKNRPLTRQRVWQLIQDWTLMSGVRKEGEGRYGCHSLRKTFGFQAWKLGVTTEELQKKFGHRSAEVTRRYIGISQDMVRAIEMKVSL